MQSLPHQESYATPLLQHELGLPSPAFVDFGEQLKPLL